MRGVLILSSSKTRLLIIIIYRAQSNEMIAVNIAVLIFNIYVNRNVYCFVSATIICTLLVTKTIKMNYLRNRMSQEHHLQHYQVFVGQFNINSKTRDAGKRKDRERSYLKNIPFSIS